MNILIEVLEVLGAPLIAIALIFTICIAIREERF